MAICLIINPLYAKITAITRLLHWPISQRKSRSPICLKTKLVLIKFADFVRILLVNFPFLLVQWTTSNVSKHLFLVCPLFFAKSKWHKERKKISNSEIRKFQISEIRKFQTSEIRELQISKIRNFQIWEIRKFRISKNQKISNFRNQKISNLRNQKISNFRNQKIQRTV